MSMMPDSNEETTTDRLIETVALLFVTVVMVFLFVKIVFL
jgi:hypothetical protein